MSVAVSNILPDGWLDLFDRDAPRIGIGLDPATTTKRTSNPSAIAVVQEVGLMRHARLILRYKSADPEVTTALFDAIVGGLRGAGLRVRRICILATSERYFAVAVKKQFTGRAPVELVIESANIRHLGEEMRVKAYLGNLVVGALDDGYLSVPAEPWLKQDLRLVVRDRGTFDAELGKDGGHGDTFAALGASLHALKGAGGKTEAAGVPVGSFRGTTAPTRQLLNPFAKKFGRNSSGRQLT